MDSTPWIYFAHPVNTYDTDVEKAVLILIAHCFATVRIENPNSPEYQKLYNEKKQASGGTHGDHKGMDIFYEILKDPNCIGAVAMPFLDRRMGLGVAGETQKVLKLGKKAWFIEPHHELSPEELDAFIANPLNGAFSLREMAGFEAREFLRYPDLKRQRPPFVIAHEETRLRTFMQYNGAYRPYATAHVVPVPADFYALDPKKK